MNVDDFLFIGALMGLAALAAFLGWDYWLTKTKRKTVSQRCKEFMLRHKDQPLIWIFIGLMIGFAVGLITGFVLGHLFWPQYILSCNFRHSTILVDG